ncbi:MAG: TonB-dependent receptor domain-containing protein, partial [Pyrinomonadaceae bacterium]
NFSAFLSSEISNSVSNELRASYGRTRLNFEELRDTSFLRPAGLDLTNRDERRFLLNAPLLENFTLPNSANFPVSVMRNAGPVIFRAVSGRTTEQELGPVGQVIIAGFSPIGADVFNFPQRRVNNTYQLADTVSLRAGNHNVAFGTDIRRAELNSDLPRNSRPLITFNGAPRLLLNPDLTLRFATNDDPGGRFFSGVDLAAASAASGFLQTFSTTGSSGINLRYHQYYFFGQDEWRVRPNLSLSYGLRYEYTTPPREVNGLIERTFNSRLLDLAPSFRRFIDGRTEIFDPDRNNFAPRVGFAYSPNWFGPERATVIRAGYGLFYDQIIGAVVSQSRNVFPTNVTANFAGGGFGGLFGRLLLANPNDVFGEIVTLNSANRTLTPEELIELINAVTFRDLPGVLGATLPARRLKTPMAHHYSLTFEQQLNRDMVASVAYVGTSGRNLLRLTTPNLGLNEFVLPLAINALGLPPDLFGFAVVPGTGFPAGATLALDDNNNIVLRGTAGGRPFGDIGAVNIYESSANSRYDALQAQLRGRYAHRLQYQAQYTFSNVEDDVSDVFDLAGASALPQNSFNFRAERGPANFDVRHRFSYNLIYTLPEFRDHSATFRAFFGGLEFASTGQFQTGLPFTVNSIFDVNLDGNLTDRLNSTQGITRTGDNQQPLRLAGNPTTLLAPTGQDGSVPRNSFRAGNFLLLNLAIVKHFRFGESQDITFRTEFFNLTNRDNFAIPVRFLEAPGFGQATDTVTPGRRIQFALKYSF